MKPTLTLYRDFMQDLFIRFWMDGQYKRRTTGPMMFAILQSISVLYSKKFWLVLGKWLWLERKVNGLGAIAPQVFWKYFLDQILGFIVILDSTLILS